MLPLFFDISSTLAVEDRTETRVRYVDPDAVLDVETDPKLSYRGSIRHNLDSFTLSYGPRIVLTNITGDSAPVNGLESDAQKLDFIHQGNALLEWQWGPRTRFISNNVVQYGTASVGTLLVQPRWNGEDRPLAARPFSPNARARFDFLSLNLESGFFHFVTPRLSVAPSVFYLTYGGPDAESRKRLNYLQNPGFKVAINYSLWPTDDLIIEVAPQVNIFTSTTQALDTQLRPLDTNGQVVVLDDQGNVPAGVTPQFVSRDAPPIYQGYGETRWRHRFSALTSTELAGGVNATFQDRSTNPDDPFNFSKGPTSLDARVFPIAEALVNVGFKTSFAKGRLIAYSRLAPWLNLLTGDNQERSENVLAAAFVFGLNTVRAQAGFYTTLPDEQLPFRQITGELSYERKITKAWSFDIGARVGQQTANVPDFTKAKPLDEPREISTFQPGGFVGIAFQPQNVKF